MTGSLDRGFIVRSDSVVRGIRRRTAGAWLAVPAWAGLLASGPALAQNAPQGPALASNEIIVTAQRRAEALENVPAAITALNAETIENAGVTNLQDIGRVAAGVQVGLGGAFTSPAVRGVSTITNGNNIENNVAIYIDGFYEPNTLGINTDLPNIASVEILKGPQGTLYGRNATGGAILINTLQPSDVLTGRAEVTYARFNDKRASGYISGPITDGLRFSLAAYNRHSDGYMKLADPNVIGGTIGDAAPLRQVTVRSKLESDLTENLTATLGYNYMHSNDPRGLLFSTFEHVPANFPAPPLRPVELGTAAYNYQTRLPTSSHQGTLKLEWQTGIGTLTSYSGYTWRESRTEFDFDGTYADFVYSTNRFEQDTYQQAVDLLVDSVEGLDLIVGGLWYKDDNGMDPDIGTQSFGPNRRLTLRNVGAIATNAWAVYADATYAVTDRLSLNLGGRYSSEKKEVDFTTYNFTTNPAGAITFGPFNEDATFKKFTPSASIRYEVAPRTNVYASYRRGFRSGNYSLSPPADPALYNPVRPEVIDAFEVGFKTAGDVIRFDAAAFYYDYKDLHVNVTARSPLCPPGPCGLNISLFQNAPKAEIYGLDAQVSATPLENLNVRGGFAWLHARFGDFPNATGTGLNPVTDTNFTQGQDWSGQQLTRAPDFTANFGVDYEIPIEEGGILFSTNVSYTDSYVVNNPSLFGPLAGELADQQRFRQGAYALVNASVTWTEPNGHFYVGVFGRNLTDHEYRMTYNGGANGDYSTLAEPLTYGVRAGFRY
jgi:iron complex outermembrane receptor protein